MRQPMLLRSYLALLCSLALVCAGVTPVLAQSAPGAGAWQAGPAGNGDRNVLAGVIDAPSSRARVPQVSLALSGWFVDLTAQGWTGVDDVEIFLGTMDSGRPLGHATFQQ